jgi:hypothetical protein
MTERTPYYSEGECSDDERAAYVQGMADGQRDALRDVPWDAIRITIACAEFDNLLPQSTLYALRTWLLNNRQRWER